MQTKKILIVDDDEPILNGISDKFTHEGFSVFKAKNGQEGFDVALREHPDLIITDILMPNINGLLFLENLRKDEWGKDARVLIWSNSHNSTTVEQAKKLGVIEFVIKSDWEYKDVVNKVRVILGM
jgi:PleD family two-component response regulator